MYYTSPLSFITLYLYLLYIGLGLNNNSYSPMYSYVLSMYINEKKGFAFVELPTMELTTACLSLDGIFYMVNNMIHQVYI